MQGRLAGKTKCQIGLILLHLGAGETVEVRSTPDRRYWWYHRLYNEIVDAGLNITATNVKNGTIQLENGALLTIVSGSGYEELMARTGNTPVADIAKHVRAGLLTRYHHDIQEDQSYLNYVDWLAVNYPDDLEAALDRILPRRIYTWKGG